MNGTHASEFTLERLQNIEDKATNDFYRENGQDVAYAQVTEIKNVYLMQDQRLSQIEVLNGRYNLKINARQSMPKKIEKFACEPVAFYLHKKNDFLTRLLGKDQVNKFREEKGLRDIIKSLLATKLKPDNKSGPSFKEHIVKRIQLQQLKKQRSKGRNKDNSIETRRSGLSAGENGRRSTLDVTRRDIVNKSNLSMVSQGNKDT